MGPDSGGKRGRERINASVHLVPTLRAGTHWMGRSASLVFPDVSLSRVMQGDAERGNESQIV